MRERIARFMDGRNGLDQLNRALWYVYLALFLLSVLLGRTALGSVLSLLGSAVLVLIIFRMLSRDRCRRRSENERFLRFFERQQAKLRVLKERWVQRKDYKFFTCPSCKSVMRVPRGRGKIRIVCHKCGNTFTGKS